MTTRIRNADSPPQPHAAHPSGHGAGTPDRTPPSRSSPESRHDRGGASGRRFAPARRYAAALGTVLAFALPAVLLREATGIASGNLALLVVGVLVATYLAGLAPGMAAAAFAVFLADLLFFQPRYRLDLGNGQELVALAIFALAAIVAGGMYGSAQRARRAAEERGAERDRLLAEADAQRAILTAQQEASVQGLLLVDPGGRMLTFNQRFVEMWGLPAAVLESGSDDAALDAVRDNLVEPDRFLDRVRYLYAHPDERGSDEIRLRDGRIFERYTAPVHTNGRRLGRIWYFRDITQERRAEQRLVQREAQYRTLVEAAPVFVWHADADGQVTYSSQSYYQYSGVSPASIGSVPWTEARLVHPDDDPQLRERWIHSISTGEPFEMEMRLRGADGIYRWHLNRALPVRDAHGAVTGWVGTATNIDDRKREELEQELLAAIGRVTASEIALQEILDGVVDSIAGVFADSASLVVRGDDGSLERVATSATDPDAREINRTYRINAGAQDGIARVFTSGASQLHRTISDEFLRTVASSAQHLARLRTAGLRSAILAPVLSRGEVAAVLAVGRYKDGRTYDERDLALVEEIARRAGLAMDNARLYEDARRSEAALAAQLKRMETLLQVAPVGIGIAHDPRCERITTNEMFAAMLRLPSGANASRTAPPDERPGFRTMRDGVELAGDDLPIQRAAATGRQVGPESVDLVFDDGATLNLLGTAAPLTDGQGNVTGAVGAFMDVTELRRIEDELRRANAAKDEFLGLVSHELKTPMTTILGNAQVLVRSGPSIDDDDRAAALADIASEAERLHGIIENLLTLARVEAGQEVELEPVLVARIVRRCVDDHRRVYPRSVRFEDRSAQAFVLAQPVYIRQAVLNLLSNAEKYGRPDEPTDIAIDRRAGEVRVHVMDRGPGVPEGDSTRIFEPFYRSDGAAHQASGVGIGLTVCKRLVEAQGGHMWAAAREGGGADIGFALPLAEVEPEP